MRVVLHTLYYQFSNTRFKLELFQNNIDFWLDQLNVLEVEFLKPDQYDVNQVQDIIDKGDCIISHYKISSTHSTL